VGNILEDKKLELEYPCKWDYKVIINSNSCIESIITSTIDEKEYICKKSHTSKNKKYQTYNVTLLVHNEDERVETYHQLKKHEDVKIVL
jgi:putative lipoic acid-binding regulatory protein